MRKYILLLFVVFGEPIFAREITTDPYPVNLLGLVGFKTGIIERTIYWQTNQEKNLDYFEIQRSMDARVFEKVGVVKSIGNNKTGNNNYEFADINSNYFSYYRLKILDTNGTWSLSKVIVIDNTIIVNINTKEPIIGNFYPNPTTSTAVIELFLIAEEEWDMSVYDSKGNLNFTQKNLLPIGLINIGFGEIAFKAGLNIIVMESKSTKIRKCIVKN